MYEHGWGVTLDYGRAMELYNQALDNGSLEAQTNLGVMYRQGMGVPQDYSEAARRFRVAADASPRAVSDSS